MQLTAVHVSQLQPCLDSTDRGCTHILPITLRLSVLAIRWRKVRFNNYRSFYLFHPHGALSGPSL